MASKKQQDFTAGVDALFSNPQKAEDLKPASGEKYNFNLKMPVEWKEQISYQAWLRRETITDLLNEIIGEWLQANYKEDPMKGGTEH